MEMAQQQILNYKESIKMVKKEKDIVDRLLDSKGKISRF